MNKTYKDYTPAELRVLIAQDALDQVKSKHFEPKIGTFILPVFTLSAGSYSRRISKEVLDNTPTCEVCAKGSVFAAWILRFNEFDEPFRLVNCSYRVLDEGDISLHEHKFPEGFLEVFTREIYDRMEAMFEGESNSTHYNEEETKLFTDYLFHELGDDASYTLSRFVETMNYLISNKGEFPIPS